MEYIDYLYDIGMICLIHIISYIVYNIPYLHLINPTFILRIRYNYNHVHFYTVNPLYNLINSTFILQIRLSGKMIKIIP